MQAYFEGYQPRVPPSPTHLDSTETPVQSERAPASWDAYDTPYRLSTNFRHSGWTELRQLTLDAMCRCRLPLVRIKAFATCGVGTWIMRHKDDRELFRAVPEHCHDRFCIPCASARQAIIRRNLDHYLADRPHRFLTLTVRSSGEPLLELLKRLYTAFRRLRSRAFWKQRVRGGVAFLELTYNPQRQSWNPHLHAMLDGKYLDLQALSKTWLAVTGDSMNVKINLIRQRKEVTNYITKYATKPLPASVIRCSPALDECLQALRRRRMILTFGTWKRWRLLDDPSELDWDCVDHLDAIHWQALNGDPLAVNIIAMLPTADPHNGQFFVHVESDPPEE